MTGSNVTVIQNRLIDTEFSSLTQARKSIGEAHKSKTCIKTQDGNKREIAGCNEFLFFNTLALSAFVNTIVEAAYLFGYRAKANAAKRFNPNLNARAKVAYAFIMGTGLERMIEYYSMDYEPETFREKLHECFKTSSGEYNCLPS